MVCIELYLACRNACRPTVSVTVGVRHATAWQEKKIRVQTRGHDAYPGNQ
jgi:hypothetical protein